MLENVLAMFQRHDPRKQAAVALARIVTQYDMCEMKYSEGLETDRRAREERHVAIGVWLIPVESGASQDDFDFSAAVPAVTQDLRANGFGVMTPVRLDATQFVTAIPDLEEHWKFFLTSVRHNTRRPGSWYQLGLKAESLLSLEQEQMHAFNRHVDEIHAAAPA